MKRIKQALNICRFVRCYLNRIRIQQPKNFGRYSDEPTQRSMEQKRRKLRDTEEVPNRLQHNLQCNYALAYMQRGHTQTPFFVRPETKKTVEASLFGKHTPPQHSDFYQEDRWLFHRWKIKSVFARVYHRIIRVFAGDCSHFVASWHWKNAELAREMWQCVLHPSAFIPDNAFNSTWKCSPKSVPFQMGTKFCWLFGSIY